MIVTDYTRRALAYRRQKRKLTRLGYIYLSEVYWPLNRGDEIGRKIVEVIISTDGTGLYVKLSEKPGAKTYLEKLKS